MRGLLRMSVFVVLAGAWWAAGQEGKAFFRVVSPTDTQIVGFGTDGFLVWTNGAAGGTCTVQRATALNGSTNWTDFVQHAVTGAVMSLRVFDADAPSGMALIPAGSFAMGDNFTEGYNCERPVHTVYVSAFYMDKYEVTKAKWDEVYAWAVANGYSFDYAGSGKAADHPVQTVNWYDCVKWCNARSEKEGRTPCYTSGGATYKAGQYDDIVCIWSAAGYRLPTEAEWEKAARGGLSGRRFPWGDTIQHSLANYNSGSYSYDTSPTHGYHPTYNDGAYPYTSPAGAFAANGYGLYDMLGNVWEWCWDLFGAYPSGSVNNPRGPSSGSMDRVFRGGGWSYPTDHCRTASRDIDYPWNSGEGDVGFRAVLASGQQ